MNTHGKTLNDDSLGKIDASKSFSNNFGQAR